MRKVATIILSLGSIIGVIQAETLAVLAGGSIQEKIDLAVDGDIVAIFGGTYNQDLTITKRIRLVEVNGQEVTLAGNITFSGIADCPPFEGFTVGSQSKDIAVNDCTGLVISEIDHTAGRSINVNLNSDIEIKDSTLNSVDIRGEGTVRNITTTGGFTFDGSKIVVTDSTIGGSINHKKGELDISNVTINENFDTQNAATKTVAFRTTVTGDCNWKSKLSWFGYGKARSFNFEGDDAKVVFVGSEIDRQNGERSGIAFYGGNNLYTVVNSHIHNVRARGDSGWRYHNCIDIIGRNHVVKIFNNYLSTNHGDRGDTQTTISLSNEVTNAKIIGNIFREDHRESWTYAVIAPFGGLIEGNLWAGKNPTGHEFLVAGGVSLGKNNIRAHYDSLFVDGDPYKLAEDSPAINSGTEDPRYNDRDGTRNNLGPSGGSWYDPEGWTTEKPVVISFDLLPDSVLEGVDTEVTIEGVRAVSKP
ncbi:hypothetical protein OAF08_00910 [bacterium]|nr:hypothetical protein [bacterium]